jgi:peptidyl-tRNA hydrolase, PTH1 family
VPNSEAGASGRAIIGLGNPGSRYEKTRHNIGFMAIDAYAASLGISGNAFHKSYYFLKTYCGNRDIILCKPWTFMNCSGEAVLDLIERESLDPSEMLVVYDDVALPTGRIRLRRSGGSGGHNGMESIIDALQTTDFPRLRCGIGNPPRETSLVDYVLNPFGEDEFPAVQTMIGNACGAITRVLQAGLEQAMNLYNRAEEPTDAEPVAKARQNENFENRP